MKTALAIILMGGLCLGLLSDGVSRAAEKKPTLLFDGCALNGAAGTLVGPLRAGRWFFKLEKDVTDGKAIVGAGTQLQLLPSSGLERLISDANESKSKSYRLWGRVTKYQGTNFIFPMQYLALDGAPRVKPSEPEEKEKEKKEATGPAADTNDVVSLPVEVLEKLRSRKIIRIEQLRKPLDLKQDSMLADRTGFLSKTADGGVFFTLDSLGRNAPRVSFALLPCEALEKAENEQAKNAEHLRMKAAGVLTRYKGTYYLLLQRANRVYGHGNFGK